MNRKKLGIKIREPLRATGRSCQADRIAASVRNGEHIDNLLKTTGVKFGQYVKDLGYEDYSYEVVSSPHVTNRGLLRAKGTFRGPNPYGDADRPVEDEYDYTFYVTEDTNYGDILALEVKLSGAMLAKYKILPDGLYILDGALPHA